MDLATTSGIGGLLQGANDAYWKQKQYDLQLAQSDAEKKRLGAQLAAEGFQQDENGNFTRTAESKREKNLEEATKQAGILKSGYKAVENPETHQFELTKVPGFRDLEEENKTLQNQKLRTELSQGKKPAQNEFAAAGYAKRLEDAESVFSDLQKKGYDPAGASSSIQKAGFFPDMLQSEDVRQEQQAKTNFVNALLRRESGAAISAGEFATANKQYFPQPGDTASVLKQKELNRRLVFENLRAEGSRAYGKSPSLEETKGLIGMGKSQELPSQKSGSGLLNSAVAAEKPMSAFGGYDSAPKAANAEDLQAIDWAKSNPKDPRSAEILRMHGIK